MPDPFQTSTRLRSIGNLTLRSHIAAHLAFFLLLVPTLANACTCFQQRLPEEEQIAWLFERSALVVVARVGRLSTMSSETGAITTTGLAEVVESIKTADATPTQIRIEMHENRNGYRSSCNEGATLESGDYLLLYLDQPLIVQDSFHDCTRSRVAKHRTGFDSEVVLLKRLAGAH